MKKWFILGMLVVLGITLAETPDMIYHPYFVNTYPDPAMPGQMVRVEVTLQNVGGTTFYNITTKLEPTWPFKENKTTGFVSRLDPGQTATVVYYIYVDKSADPGQYTLIHKLTYYYGEWNDNLDRMDYFKIESTRTIGINVKNKERVEIVDISYPNQILSGGQGSVAATIKNTGNVPINDIHVSLSGTSPYLVPLAPSSKYIDVLNPGDEKQLEFKFKASPTATTGTFSLSLLVSYGSTQYSIPVSVSILGYPGIEISRVSFNKTPEPGKETTMTVCIKNMGADLGNFYVSLTPPMSMGKQQTNVESLIGTEQTETSQNDIVILGGAMRFVKDLESGETECFNFTISLSEDAKERPYYLYLSMYGGNFQEEKIPIGINVKGIPSLSISDVGYDQEFIYAGIPFKISVQFENSGTGKAKEVKIIANNETSYLGSIEPDDTSTAVFRMVANKPGEHKLKFIAYYQDKDGINYNQTFYVDVVVGNKPLPYGYLFGLLVVLILAAVMVYKVKRK